MSVTVEGFTKAILAAESWRQARRVMEQPNVELLRAMALITRNRVRSGWHGGNWLAVMAGEHEYSAYIEPTPAGLPDMRSDAMLKFLWDVDRIYDGTYPDAGVTGDPPALWWAELNKITRDWFLDRISRDPANHPRVAHLGAITMFA